MDFSISKFVGNLIIKGLRYEALFIILLTPLTNFAKQAVFEKLVDEICSRLAEITESTHNGLENGVHLDMEKDLEESGGCSC